MVSDIEKSKLYVEHEDLLASRAYAYSSMYKTDYSDARSKATEVFCRVVEGYDPDLGKFSTMLYAALQSLQDEMKTEVKWSAASDPIGISDPDGSGEGGDSGKFSDGVPCPNDTNGDYELHESAKRNLDEDSMFILGHIFTGTFEAAKEGGDPPGLGLIEICIKEYWDWPRSRILRAFAHIKSWYHREIAI